ECGGVEQVVVLADGKFSIWSRTQGFRPGLRSSAPSVLWGCSLLKTPLALSYPAKTRFRTRLRFRRGGIVLAADIPSAALPHQLQPQAMGEPVGGGEANIAFAG